MARETISINLNPVYRDKKTGQIVSVLPAQPVQADTSSKSQIQQAQSSQEKKASSQSYQPVFQPAFSHKARQSSSLLADMERAAWQVALERRNFSCGTIDGDWGMRTHRAIRQFQKTLGLPITGELDEATKVCLGTPHAPFYFYTVTAEDMAKVVPTPATWKAKSEATYLGYNDSWEMLAEKFHTTSLFLQQLNPTCSQPQAGVSLQVPNLEPTVPLPMIGEIHILLSETTVLLFDKQRKCVGCFPCSIAADKNKRPSGDLHVIAIAPNPNYTFNPDLFPDVATQEGIKTKVVIPPGPNNPVGMAWIGLSLPGYGMHGTPEPSAISRTGSKGCFRLANWNAVRLIGKVSKGTPVIVEP